MSSDPRMVDGRYESLVVLLALLLDVGWCLERPDISMPGLIVGLLLQLFIAASLSSTGTFHALQQWALFCWMVSSGLWIFGEFLWDEERPVGFLSRVPMLLDMDDHLVLALSASAVLLWGSFLALFVAQVRRSLSTTEAGTVFQLDAQDIEDWWFTLWMLFDANWNVCDIFYVWGWRPTLFSLVALVAGAASLLLIASCVRKHADLGDRAAAATSVGEFMWVAGNMVWFIDDVLDRCDSRYGTPMGASLMCVGIVFCLASVAGFCRGPSEQPLLPDGLALSAKVPARAKLSWVCPPA